MAIFGCDTGKQFVERRALDRRIFDDNSSSLRTKVNLVTDLETGGDKDRSGDAGGVADSPFANMLFNHGLQSDDADTPQFPLRQTPLGTSPIPRY